MVETRMKCKRCGAQWTADFPKQIRQTSYQQKLKSFLCLECNSNWLEHRVLGPEPEIIPSQRAESPRTEKENA